MATITSRNSLIASLEQHLTSKVGCSKVLVHAEYLLSTVEFYGIPGIHTDLRLWVKEEDIFDTVDLNQKIEEISKQILQEFEDIKQKIVSLNEDEQFALEMINKDKNTLKLIEHPTDKQRRFHAMRWKI